MAPDRRCCGELPGISARLDYLQELDVGALCLNLEFSDALTVALLPLWGRILQAV